MTKAAYEILFEIAPKIIHIPLQSSTLGDALIKFNQNHSFEMKKLAIFALDTKFLAFTKRFETRLFGNISSKGLKFIIEKRLTPFRIRNLSNWADYVVVDFLTPLGVQVTKYSSKPVHIRIHRYELDFPDLFDQVKWNNVASVIADSEFYAGLLKQYVPSHIPMHIMHAGVNVKNWPFHPSSSGKLCTWALPTDRKRIYDLMLALRNETLYIGGKSAASRYLIEANNRFSLNHILEPEVDFPQWQWDKEFYIHHSLDEGLPVSVGEAMVSGLIPFVHRFPSATEIVPKELTYIYNDDLLDLIREFRSKSKEEILNYKHQLRDIVLEKFGSEPVGDKLETIFLETEK